MRPSRLLFLALITAAGVAAFFVLRPHRRQPPHVSVRRLAALPDTYRARTIAIADDGEEYAYVVGGKDTQRVVHGGQEGPTYKEVSLPLFTPASRQLFHWATEMQSGMPRLVLVANGQAITAGFPKPGKLVFSKDGKRWAVAGVVTEHNEGEDADLLPAVVVLADGRQVGRYRDATLPAFSPDGMHLAYLVQDDSQHIKLIVDGAERRTFETPTVKASPPVGTGSPLMQQFRSFYLSDGRLVVLTQDRDGWVVYRGAERLAAYTHNIATGGGITFSFGAEFHTAATIFANSLNPNVAAATATWWERQAGETERWRVVRDGKAEPTVCVMYWENAPPLASNDGKRIAYPCYVTPPGAGGGRVDMVVDDRRYGPYTNIWGAAFSDDGRHVCYGASNGSLKRGWSFYRDGERYPLTYDEVWRPRFSPDGTRIAWEAQRGKRATLMLDGDSLYSYDEILWGPTFTTDTTVAWVVRRGKRLMRVEATW